MAMFAMPSFVNAQAAPACSSSISLSVVDVSPEARRFNYTVHSEDGCDWRVVSKSPFAFVSRGSGQGASEGYLTVAANPTFGPRDIIVEFNGVPLNLSQQASLDTDRDGLPDSWERQFGLSVTPYADGFDALGDPDWA